MKNRGIGILLSIIMVIAMIGAVPTPVRAANAAPLVIVLDAGHGGVGGGATYTWSGKKYMEKELNLQIAKYAKQELEQYLGVKVYLTRTGDTTVSLKDRITYAKGKNADLFVSLHNNASTRSTVRGASVYYPNYNYRKEIGEEGRSAALQVQKQLAALGLKNLGATYRNSETNTRYADSKLADYYYVIKHSKLSGFPGIIVEHAFVSNSSDCKQYLNSNAQLKKLGIADAKGIADAYGLVKGQAPTLKSAESLPDGSIALTWTESKNMNGYEIYRRKAGAKKYKLVAKIAGSKKTSYTDDTTIQGRTHEYCIRAKVKVNGVTYYSVDSNLLRAAVRVVPEVPDETQTPEPPVQDDTQLPEPPTQDDTQLPEPPAQDDTQIPELQVPDETQMPSDEY